MKDQESGPHISEEEARSKLHAFVHNPDSLGLSTEERDKVIGIAFNGVRNPDWESALDVMSDDEAKTFGADPNMRENARQQRGRALEEARKFLDEMGYNR
ncbi:hypothetical protein HQ487_01880 [Candidatus Uhrbacteria bacterium]|nr:hypothetical protein [Candidatus Uhrbacteria bacterium]